MDALRGLALAILVGVLMGGLALAVPTTASPPFGSPAGLRIGYPAEGTFFGARNSTMMWDADGATTTTAGQLGFTKAGSTVAVPPALATTSLWASLRRFRLTTTTAAANVIDVRGAAVVVLRGAAINQGGWFMQAVCTGIIVAAAGRGFIGLSPSTSALPGNADPNALVNTAYFGFNAGDANWSFCSNDGSGTATCSDLGANFPTQLTTDGIDFRMYAGPFASSISWQATLLSDSSVSASGSVSASADLPVNTTMLTPHIYINDGTAGGTAHQLECLRMYLATPQ